MYSELFMYHVCTYTAYTIRSHCAECTYLYTIVRIYVVYVFVLNRTYHLHYVLLKYKIHTGGIHTAVAYIYIFLKLHRHAGE